MTTPAVAAGRYATVYDFGGEFGFQVERRPRDQGGDLITIQMSHQCGACVVASDTDLHAVDRRAATADAIFAFELGLVRNWLVRNWLVRNWLAEIASGAREWPT